MAGGGGGIATGAGTRIDVTLKLPQLQNLCKRDPTGYWEDYQAQTRRLEQELALFLASSATTQHGRVVELIQFAAAVSSSSYKGEESDRIAKLYIDLLQHNATSLHKDVRKACVSALILMRNKGAVKPLDILELFFTLLANVVDKQLRELLYHHMVNDIRNINKKGKRDDKLNKSVQVFLHRIVNNNDSNEVATKRALDMVCELYRRRVWTDERTVAIVASAVQHSTLTVACRAMRFFLGIEEKMAEDEKIHQADDYSEKNAAIDYHLHSKKTCKRHRQTTRALKNRKRALDKQKANEDWLDVDPNKDQGVEASKSLYPAMELLRDPQGLAEAVFARLKTGHVKYEHKLVMVNFVTRLTGNQELLLLPLYSFLQKYMASHQRDVTALLAYAVQACHEQVPPDAVFGMLKTIAHNFITERCSEEQMAVGINAARAICARVPSVLLANEDDPLDDETNGGTATTDYLDVEALARDLAGFAKHRDRSVSMAGKAWMNFVRQVHPALLQGKDRGLQGSALHKNGTKPLRYGESKASAGVEGADLLLEYESKKAAAAAAARKPDGGDDDDESGGSDIEDDDDEEAPTLVRLDDDDSKPPAQTEEEKQGAILDVSKMSAEERDKLKQQVSSTRIFSASEFERMRRLVEREQTAKRDPREAARRKRAIARGEEFEALSGDDDDDTDSEDETVRIKGAVNPTDIMATATRKRLTKAEKLEKIIEGRSQFEQKQRHGSSTNTEKNRKKNFLMSKFSKDARRKGRGKSGLQMKKREMAAGGTHEAKKRRRKL